MFSDLNVFKTAFAMAAHAGKRQAVIAQNVSNADTPGYAAKDVPDFSSTYELERGDSMRATRVAPSRLTGSPRPSKHTSRMHVSLRYAATSASNSTTCRSDAAPPKSGRRL